MDDPSYNFRYACGYCKPIQQINKKEFLNAVWLHYVFFQPHAELVQLKSGFWETLQVELLACMHGKEIRAYLACSPAFNVSVKCLQEMFAIRYSDNGTNDRTKEEAVIISTGWITSRIANVSINCTNCFKYIVSALIIIVQVSARFIFRVQINLLEIYLVDTNQFSCEYLLVL